MRANGRVRVEKQLTVLKAAPRKVAKRRPAESSMEGVAAELLNLQRSAGNRAVVNLLAQSGRHEQADLPLQRIWYAEGKSVAGKVLVPKPVKGEGAHENLKFNRKEREVPREREVRLGVRRGGRRALRDDGRSGGGKFNTAFWKVKDDEELELHVHMGNTGALMGRDGDTKSSFKRGERRLGQTVTNKDLKDTFKSGNVKEWTKTEYTIR